MPSYSLQRIPRPGRVGPLAAYATTFSVAENPLSEGGRWMQNDNTATSVQTTGGSAYGTQTAGAPFAPYDDSGAELGGFGVNYEVTATIIKASGLDAVNREVEIRLRWISNDVLRTTAFGDTHSNGYEIAVQHNGCYLNCGRFKAANLVGIGDGSTPGSIGFTPTTGDKFTARIQGQHIQVFWNGTVLAGMDVTDNDAALKIIAGNPGIGFFVNAGPPFPGNTDFGFSDWSVIQL